MARLLAVNDFIELPTAINVGDAYSFWIKMSSVAANAEIMSRHSATSSNGGWNLVVNNSTGVLFLGIKSGGGGYTFNVSGTHSVIDGNWHHIGINLRFTAGPVAVYVDGVLDISGNNSGASGGTNTVMRIGKGSDSFWGVWNGEIAEFASWGVGGDGTYQLSAADYAALAKGVNPLRIRKNGLWAYLPMRGPTVRGYTLLDTPTVSGTTQSAHPRRIY
jgi:hypothetical protein